MANIKSIGGNPIVLGLDGLTEEAKAALGDSKLSAAAESLLGADSTAQWATRESTGSGTATVRSVQGAAVAFNQYAAAADSDTWVTTRCSKVVDASTNTMTLTAGSASNVKRCVCPANVPNGHKALIRARIDATEATQNSNIWLYSGSDRDQGLQIPAGSAVTQYSGIVTANLDCDLFGFSFYASNASNGDVLVVSDALCIDLTQMFGAGNEPTTVAEFERMYPEAYYPYSAPTLKPVQIAGIASTDAQGGELDGVEWDVSAYFPGGMWSSGPYNDTLFADHAEKKIDVGTIASHGAVTTGSSSKYCPLIGTGVDSYPSSFSLGDKADTISSLLGPCVHFSGSPTELTVLRTWNGMYAYAPLSADDSVFDALVGTQVAYLKANTTTITVSPTLPMTYKVQAGGSESIIVPDGEISAAPVLTVAEGESAAELVMDALACIAAPDGPVATSSHAVNTYLTMQGKLYKVTSAIAVGETIKSGTNVTETTVMAELIARTA